MGRRRRAQKKVSTKKRAVVSKVFKCPFCSMEGAVSCYIQQAKEIAVLSCRVCGARYQTNRVNYLTEPIDIFCEWIDQCEEVNADDGNYDDQSD